MSASTSDYFRKASNGTTRPVVTYLQSAKTAGSTTATINAATGWNTTTGVDVQIYLKDTTGKKVAGSETDWIATLSGTTLSNMVLKAGVEPTAGYPAGTLSVAICTPTAAWADSMAAGILIHADQDGTLKADAVDVAAVVKDGILTAAKSTAGANIETWRSEDVFDHIASGCVWSGNAYASTRVASCTSGVVYLAGKRLTVAAVTSRTFTASRDVYCDLSDNGDGTAIWNYNDNTTNAASPALTAGRLRGAIVVVGASNIAAATSVNQGQETMVLPIASSVPYAVTDSLGNLICPRDPYRKILGYRRKTSSQGSITGEALITELAVPFIAPTGRKIKATIYGTASNTGTGTNTVRLRQTNIAGSILQSRPSFVGGATASESCEMTYVCTPTAGANTYVVSVQAAAGTTTWDASAGGSFIMIELI